MDTGSETAPVSILIKLADGRLSHCHQDQVRKCTVHAEMELEKLNTDLNLSLLFPQVEEHAQSPTSGVQRHQVLNLNLLLNRPRQLVSLKKPSL